MATPERRTAPGTPAVPVTAPVSTGPVPVMAPFGWLLVIAAGFGLIAATWLAYGTGADGMWAGYRDGVIGTIALVCAMALNTTLPRQPSLVVIGLCGILLILFAAFLADETAVFVAELSSGIVMLAGLALYVSGRKS